MNPQGADLLAQLRDIHSAPVEPWWPPAPGWWMLAAMLAFGLFLLARRVLEGYRLRQRRRRLAGYVDAIETVIDPASAPQAFLSAINGIFKIVTIEAFPDANCAGMQGAEWVAFLQRNIVSDERAAQLQALAEGPYRPVTAFEPETLAGLARHWIRHHG